MPPLAESKHPPARIQRFSQRARTGLCPGDDSGLNPVWPMWTAVSCFRVPTLDPLRERVAAGLSVQTRPDHQAAPRKGPSPAFCFWGNPSFRYGLPCCGGCFNLSPCGSLDVHRSPWSHLKGEPARCRWQRQGLRPSVDWNVLPPCQLGALSPPSDSCKGIPSAC